MADIDVEKLRSFLSNPDNMVQTDAGADAGAGSDAGAAGSGEQGAAEQQTVIQPQVGDQLDKDANAFAQMRVQNKLMGDMLAKVAQANGIQFTSQDDLLQKLNDDVLTKQAQAQGEQARSEHGEMAELRQEGAGERQDAPGLFKEGAQVFPLRAEEGILL